MSVLHVASLAAVASSYIAYKCYVTYLRRTADSPPVESHRVAPTAADTTTPQNQSLALGASTASGSGATPISDDDTLLSKLKSMISKKLLKEDTSNVESSAAMTVVRTSDGESIIPIAMRDRSVLAQNEALVDVKNLLGSSLPNIVHMTALTRLAQSSEQFLTFQVQLNLFIETNAAIPWPKLFLACFTWPQFTRILFDMEQNVASVFVWFTGSIHGMFLAIRGWSLDFISDIWDYLSPPLALHDFSLIPLAIWVLTCTALIPLLVCLLVMWQPTNIYNSASHTWSPVEAVVHNSTLSALLARSTKNWLRWITFGASLVIQTLHGSSLLRPWLVLPLAVSYYVLQIRCASAADSIATPPVDEAANNQNAPTGTRLHLAAVTLRHCRWRCCSSLLQVPLPAALAVILLAASGDVQVYTLLGVSILLTPISALLGTAIGAILHTAVLHHQSINHDNLSPGLGLLFVVGPTIIYIPALLMLLLLVVIRSCYFLFSPRNFQTIVKWILFAKARVALFLIPVVFVPVAVTCLKGFNPEAMATLCITDSSAEVSLPECAGWVGIFVKVFGVGAFTFTTFGVTLLFVWLSRAVSDATPIQIEVEPSGGPAATANSPVLILQPSRFLPGGLVLEGRALRSLTSPFKSDAFWWKSTFFIERVALVITSVLISGSQMRAAVALAIYSLSLSASVYSRPYAYEKGGWAILGIPFCRMTRSQPLDVSEALSKLALTVNAGVGLALLRNEISEKVGLLVLLVSNVVAMMAFVLTQDLWSFVVRLAKGVSWLLLLLLSGMCWVGGCLTKGVKAVLQLLPKGDPPWVKATRWVNALPCTQALCSVVSKVCGGFAEAVGCCLCSEFFYSILFLLWLFFFVAWLAFQAFRGASALYSSLQQLPSVHAIFVSDEELALLAKFLVALLLTYHLLLQAYHHKAKIGKLFKLLGKLFECNDFCQTIRFVRTIFINAIRLLIVAVGLSYMLSFVYALLYGYAHSAIAITGNAYVIMAHKETCSAVQVVAAPADENRCRNKGAAVGGILCALLLWFFFLKIVRATSKLLESIMKSMASCCAKMRSALLNLSPKQCCMEFLGSVNTWRKAMLDAARAICKQGMSFCSACWHAVAHAFWCPCRVWDCCWSACFRCFARSSVGAICCTCLADGCLGVASDVFPNEFEVLEQDDEELGGTAEDTTGAGVFGS